MPFDEQTSLPAKSLHPGEPLAPAPDFTATLGAAFRQSNMVGSIVSSEALADKMSGDFYTVDRSYNVFDDVKGYEDHLGRFENVFNGNAAKAVKADIDRETRDRQTLAASGWTGTGLEVGASVLDPTILMPAGALVRVGRGGYAAAKSALRLGASAGVATAVQEVGLQASQETRTAGESALAVGGSMLLGGLLGAGTAHVMTALERKAAGAALKAADRPDFDVSTDELHKELAGMVPRPGSVGAAAADLDTLDDLSIAGRAASGVAKATAKLNPLLRAMTSPSQAVRSVASMMMETPVYLRKNLAGRGDAAAESVMKEFTHGAVARALEAQERAYIGMRKSGVVMTRKEFREAVGRAMRRNDEDPRPAVAEVAKSWRSIVIEPLKRRAVETGLLPEDVHVSTADSYFTRVWNRLRIEANEGEFRAIVRQYLSGALDAAEKAEAERLARKTGKLQREKDALVKGIAGREEGMQRRLETGEISADDFDEGAIMDFVRRVGAGEKPKEVENLSSWLRRQKGGLFDPQGELLAVYPEARKVPGLIRKSRRSASNDKGGEGLDDIALRAWQEGFLDSAERPTIRELLEALRGDLGGSRIVRAADQEAAQAADVFAQTMRALDRAGVDFARPLLPTSEDMKDIALKVNRALSDLDREKMAKLDADIAGSQQRGRFEFLDEADRQAYIDEIVDDIYSKVTGREHEGATPLNLVATKRGPLAARTFHIPDALVEKFLDDDAEFIGRRYARVMSADVELTERFGSVDMKQQIETVRQEYAALKQAVEARPDLLPEEMAKQLASLNKRERDDIRDIGAVRDLLRGNYRPEVQNTGWARTINSAMLFNYMVALGGVVVSSLTDAVRPAMVHGLGSYMRAGLLPLISRSKGIKMATEEARQAGAIAERILQSRLATLAEITDPYAQNSPFERFLQNASVGFSRLTGLLHWNDFQKTLAATMTQDRILKNAEIAAERGFDALPAPERAYMGFLGLGQDRAEQLGQLFKDHGETLDGVRVANSEAWPEELTWLRRSWRAAISKDVDSIIVSKGVGDVPLLANTPTGKALLQFQSFALASNQRVLIRGLQEDKARFIGGVLGMATIGVFIYMLKQLEAGRPISDNPGTWVAEGLDRSGIFSLAFMANNALEKVGAPGLYTGSAALFSDKDQRQPASRYASRNAVASFLGPTVGTATDAVSLLSAGFGGDFTPGDVGAARRLTPYASLPYWRWLIDGMLVPALKEEVENG